MNLFKVKVLLDTNILLAPGQLGIDVFSELDRIITDRYLLCTFDSVLGELKSLIEKDRSQQSFNAKLGYVMVNQRKVKTLPSTTSYSDKCISDFSKSNKCIVVTQDKALRKKVQSHGNKTIGIRQKKYLDFF